jgi:hypothetical protein
MGEALSRRHLPAEAWGLSQVVFEVEKVTLGLVFLHYFRFSLSLSLHQRSVFIHLL